MPGYHDATFAVLERRPIVSEPRLAAIEAREDLLGVRFPLSLVAWYADPEAELILATFSNDDHPVSLAALGEPDWGDDLIADGFLVFMHENQNVARWMLPLYQGDNPPVYVQYDEPTGWSPQPEPFQQSFSDFVYSFIWDYRLVNYSACTLRLSAESYSTLDHEVLREHFVEATQTPYVWRSWEGVAHRFISGDGSERVLVYDVPAEETEWQLAADSPIDLGRLLERLWRHGAFSESASLRIRCEPGLDACWSIRRPDYSASPKPPGAIIDRLHRAGMMSFGRGPFSVVTGKLSVSDLDRRRHRTWACLDEEGYTPLTASGRLQDTASSEAPPSLITHLSMSDS